MDHPAIAEFLKGDACVASAAKLIERHRELQAEIVADFQKLRLLSNVEMDDQISNTEVELMARIFITGVRTKVIVQRVGELRREATEAYQRSASHLLAR